MGECRHAYRGKAGWVSLLLLIFGVSGSVAAEPDIRDRCLAVMREGLKSEEFWPAMHAAEALTLAGQGEEVLRALASRQESDDQKRCGLAREAARAGDRSVIPTLLTILDREGSNGHVHAAESLFKIGEVGDGVKLRKAMSRESEPRLCIMAAAALARCGNPEAVETIRMHLDHADGDVRKVAAWALGQVGVPEDAKWLRVPRGNAKNAADRAFFTHAMALLGDQEARRQLVKNLASDDPAIRVYAAEMAGICRAMEARDQLGKLLEDPVLDVRVRAAQSLIALALPAPVEDIRRDVYVASANNPRYSEGSVLALRDGSLLYATTEFIGGGADHATARIISRTSSDGGVAWGEPRVLQENVGKQNVMSVTLRRLRPGAVVGPIGLFYLVKNGPTDLKVYLRISADEARSFGKPICVTDQPGYHVMNNDRVTVLSSGRLICPIAWTADVSKGGHFVCFCFYSDDGGQTWKKGVGEVDQPKRGAMEPEVLERQDGKLLMIIRTQLGYIATSVSEDGGETWGKPGRLTVKAPEAPSTIRRIPATGDLLLVWNNTFDAKVGHGGKRTPLTAAISRDEGKTWTHLRNLEEAPDRQYAYTSILFVRDRVVLTYYVTDPKTGRISSRFRSLPLRWLYEKGS